VARTLKVRFLDLDVTPFNDPSGFHRKPERSEFIRVSILPGVRLPAPAV